MWLNLTGQPAIVLPMGETAAGLPLAVQAVARFGDEATLFRLAAQIETAAPWVDRRPALEDSRSRRSTSRCRESLMTRDENMNPMLELADEVTESADRKRQWSRHDPVASSPREVTDSAPTSNPAEEVQT